MNKDKFHEACENLDLTQLESSLNDNIVYDGLSKARFIEELSMVINNLKTHWNLKILAVKNGKCTECYCNESTSEFYDPKTGRIHLAYYITEEDGEITNIERCYASSGWVEQHKDDPF